MGSTPAFFASLYWINANRPDLFSKCKPWVTLALYGFLTLIMVATARLKWGVNAALITHYTSFSLLFWCGAIVPIVLFVFENRSSNSWKRKIALILGILFLFGYSATAVRRYTRIQEYSKRFEIGKRALYDYGGAQESDLALISNNSHEAIRTNAAYLESWRLGPFAKATGAEQIQRLLNEWEQKAHDLNLETLQVPVQSIHIEKEKASKLSDDTLKISFSHKPIVDFNVNWSEVPGCDHTTSPRIFLINSKKANYIVAKYKHFNRPKTSGYYGLPLGDKSKVFHIMALPDTRKYSFRLEYSASPPFEDELKITCMAGSKK